MSNFSTNRDEKKNAISLETFLGVDLFSESSLQLCQVLDISLLDKRELWKTKLLKFMRKFVEFLRS